MRTSRSTLAATLLAALAAPAFCAAPLLEPADVPLSEVGFADFNNDGRTDMAVRVFATGDVRVSYNIGNRFSATPDWIGYARSAPDGVNWDTLFADIDGDGRADSVDRERATGNMCVHYNTGTDFAAGAPCYSGFSRPSPRWRTFLAPIDADARADLVSIDQQTGTVYVHRNNGAGFDATPLITQASLAVPSYPSGTWQQFVADCTGDGKADLLNLDQATNTFFCHANGTTSFTAATGLIFPGPPEIYERELALGHFDGNGIADIVSHDLRTGDIVVLPAFYNVTTGVSTGHRALLRDRTLPYMRPYAQQGLAADANRSIAALAWYDNDHTSNPGRPDPNGWWALYPGAPGPIAPGYPGPYRSDTSLLGTYAADAPTTIRQHAYWLRAAGTDAIVADMTNCPKNSTAPSLPPSVEWFCDEIRATLTTYLSVTSGIRDFVPPRMAVAMRIPQDPITHAEIYSEATAIADDLYAIYTSNPAAWYTYNDGSANKNKPLLVVFAKFDAPWLTAPQWTDSRFNVRYTNGYLTWLGATTVGAAPATRYISHDLPYWNFVENVPDASRAGYYEHVYRRMPTDTTQSEQSTLWTAMWLGGTNWDGQQETTGGKVTVERTVDPLYAKPPRNALIGRFNYAVAWPDEPQEGMSTDESAYFEPSQLSGWAVYDKASEALYNLKKQRKGAPGKPVVTYRSVVEGKVVFESANYPTQYCLSANTTCSENKWEFVDVRTTCPKQSAVVGSDFYLITRNPFGDSPATLVSGSFGTPPANCAIE